MRRLVMVAVLLASVGLAPAPSALAADAVTVNIPAGPVETSIGQPFTLSGAVRNDTGQPLDGLIAHLDVVSTHPNVYVDPEDWSGQRTVYLPRLAPHSVQPVSWRGRVVNEGDFVLYVVVTSTTGEADVAASSGLRLHAAGVRTLDAARVLPVVLAVPTLLTVLLAMVGVRRRRRA